MSENLVNIDEFDKRIIYEMDKNSKTSLSELSKKLKRSKQFVLYRIKNLEKQEIITSYTAIVDMSKIGYFTFRVYFKFQQMTINSIKEFAEYIKKNLSQVWTITTMHGKWDIAIFLGVKKIQEFHDIWNKMMMNYKEKINKYNVAVYAPIYNFNRKFLFENSEKKQEQEIVRIYGAGEKEFTDHLDEKIIKNYAPNVRVSSLEIAKKLKVSPDTVRNRIRALEKRKIIAGYKIGINLEKLGYTGFRVDLSLRSIKRNKELFQFCKMHKNIYQINSSIGGADFEIEVIVKDLNHLFKIIDEIKTKFKDVVNDVDYFGFSTFPLLKYIPD